MGLSVMQVVSISGLLALGTSGVPQYPCIVAGTSLMHVP